MSAPLRRQNVRLRVACDGCSEAKVKCDKQHPSCGRCANNRVNCTYSVSRRHGKQAWHKRPASQRQGATTAITPTTSGGPQATVAIGSSTPFGETGWNPATYTYSSPWGPNQPLAPATDLYRPDYLFEPMQFWPQIDFPLNFDINDFGNSPLPTDLDGNHGPHDAAPSSGTTVVDNSPEYRARSPRPPTSTSKIHDCEARAIAVLRSLHHHHSPSGYIAQTATQELQPATPNTAPSFDKVLFANKLALSGWSELMNCSCTQCPHLGILYVSILLKVLFWYRVVAARICSRPENGQAGDNSATPNGSKLKEDVPPEFKIRLTAIQMGMLELDSEDQANIRRVILLRELERVEKAVKEMDNMKSTAETSAHSSHTAEWLGIGISKVRDQLKDVIKTVEQVKEL